jgi:regulator of nucleoside diphosphate kinase
MKTSDITSAQVEQANLTITQLDFLRLSQLISSMRERKSADMGYLKYLETELQKAKLIDSSCITPEFVTMNSIIEVTFLGINKIMQLQLVYPRKADFSKGLISILSPLGCALLGYKAGDIVSFMAPKGEQKVRIERVIFQPEANGEDLL